MAVSIATRLPNAAARRTPETTRATMAGSVATRRFSLRDDLVEIVVLERTHWIDLDDLKGQPQRRASEYVGGRGFQGSENVLGRLLPHFGRAPGADARLHVDEAVVHVTFGVLLGTRPYTSRSKSSTISGRRSFHQSSGVVTFCPFFNVSGSGRSGNGFALAGS